jgi:hypothetical protein
MAELTICERVPPSITGKVCLRSPHKTITFPPKGNLLFSDEGDARMSQNVLSRASKAIFCVTKASSHMIKDACWISSHSIVPRFMLHVVASSKSSHGILKRECVVRPPGKSKEATPDEATDKTIFLCARR